MVNTTDDSDAHDVVLDGLFRLDLGNFNGKKGDIRLI